MIVDQKVNGSFVGVYLIDGEIDGVQLATTKKPTKLKVRLVKWLLGWEWISIKKLKEKQIDGN